MDYKYNLELKEIQLSVNGATTERGWISNVSGLVQCQGTVPQLYWELQMADKMVGIEKRKQKVMKEV